MPPEDQSDTIAASGDTTRNDGDVIGRVVVGVEQNQGNNAGGGLLLPLKTPLIAEDAAAANDSMLGGGGGATSLQKDVSFVSILDDGGGGRTRERRIRIVENATVMNDIHDVSSKMAVGGGGHHGSGNGSPTKSIMRNHHHYGNPPHDEEQHPSSILGGGTTTTTTTPEELSFVPSDYHSPGRIGKIWSARLNLLTSMVGGGSLSLPLAFALAGNVFLAPLLVVVCGAVANFTLGVLMDASTRYSQLHPSSPEGRGGGTTSSSYEMVAAEAFGPKARHVTMGLVVLVCYFGALAYCVLLRDLAVPLAHAISPPSSDEHHHDDGPTAMENAVMFVVVLLITPLCTLRTLTALRQVGALSMISVAILGVCIVYRSVQCNAPNLSSPYVPPPHMEWTDYLSFWPANLRDWMCAFPLIQNCFFCHFNAIPVHNELSRPTPKRQSYLTSSTILSSGMFYLVIGFFGSMYGNCTTSGRVSGNILLDFDDDDPVLGVGRACLGLTIALAFPMQVIPARDTILRLLDLWGCNTEACDSTTSSGEHVGRETGSCCSSSGDEGDGEGGGGGGLKDGLLNEIVFDESNDISTGVVGGGGIYSPMNHRRGTLEEPLLIHSANTTDGDEGGVMRAASTDDYEDVYNVRRRRVCCPTTRRTGAGGQRCSITTGCQRRNKRTFCHRRRATIDRRGANLRILIGTLTFWAAALVASTVSSVDVVWDLLGSSLVMLIGFLIPCGSFLKLCHEPSTGGVRWKRWVSWIVLGVYEPLMIVLTANAVHNLFVSPPKR